MLMLLVHLLQKQTSIITNCQNFWENMRYHYEFQFVILVFQAETF